MSEPTLNQLLQRVVDDFASDLHLRVGMPPMMRVKGDLEPIPRTRRLNDDQMRALLGGVLTPAMKETLKVERELDFAHALPGQARFRVNVMIEQGHLSAVMRRIPEKIPTPEEIGLPPVMRTLMTRPRGLILATGATGSGKSTSLAALLRVANEERQATILTLEDPIEFTHEPINCVVRQREIGKDVLSFARGLRAALRQDPDIILVGEMRDLETTEIALTAAETGHLVLATLHTRSADGTIDRIVDQFPSTQQQQIRTQLAASLLCIMCQVLVPRADGQGRVAAHEVLINTDAVRNLIRTANGAQIRSTLQTQSRIGMQTMDKSLAALVLNGVADLEEARTFTVVPEEFDKLVGGRARSRPVFSGAPAADQGGGVSMRGQA